MNIEVQVMEIYQIFLVPMGNAKITEELEFQPRAAVLKYLARQDLDDKEALKDSEAPSDTIEKSKQDFVAPSSEIYKAIKEYTKTQKLNNTSTLISQLKSSASKEISLKSKISTGVSILYGTGVSVTPERRVSKKEYEITGNVTPNKGSNSKPT